MDPLRLVFLLLVIGAGGAVEWILLLRADFGKVPFPDWPVRSFGSFRSLTEGTLRRGGLLWIWFVSCWCSLWWCWSCVTDHLWLGACHPWWR